MLKLTLTTLQRMLFIVGLVLLSAGTGMAATLTVSNTNDSGAGSLRDTIAAAAPGDTINFAVTGTISLSSGQITIAKDLTIAGPGANLLTIQNTAAASATSRVFLVSGAVTVSISGLTISGGNVNGSSGGGIRYLGSTLTVTNSIISNNMALTGGAINGNGTLNVINSSISGNTATGGNGGGFDSGGRVNVTNSTISGNTAAVSGGGIYNLSILTVTNSTISGNRAAGVRGGGIRNQSPLTLINSTIANNTAPLGGGIYNDGNSVTSSSTIIAGNTASTGPDYSGPVTTSLGYNLVGNTTGSTGFTAPTDILNQNPLLGPLQNNGGPTETHALLAGSPAIDKGISNGLATDQRGFDRTTDQPLIANASDGTDIGAFEVVTLFMPPSDQKPGSLLVFPFYKHDAQNKADTRLTITNLGKLPINVHFLFLDGATCSEFDQFVCFTPNASIEWKASEFDPQNKGYVIAYTTDNMGRPIAYNGLIGNGFVNDGEYVGNYGAESFSSPLPVGTPLGAVATPGLSWTIPFDGIALDMTPMTFAVDIQSPVDTVNQKIVLAGLTGDAYAGALSGVTQIGTGLAYNGHEALRSFSPFISGRCFVEKVIDGTTPKVTGTLASLIPKGEVGTLRFSVTAAVGLLMTSNRNTFNGIRTLHKVQVAKSSIIIPLVMPDCQYWVTPS